MKINIVDFDGTVKYSATITGVGNRFVYYCGSRLEFYAYETLDAAVRDLNEAITDYLEVSGTRVEVC